MKTLPLTVLVHEGPLARAYLSRLRREGLQPQRILMMVYSHQTSTRKPIGRWLPSRLRLRYAQKYQEVAHNFWPRQIKRSHAPLVEAMVRGLRETCPDPAGWIEAITGRFDYARYGNRFDRVLVKGLRDAALREALACTEPQLFLFTGGGLVPTALLDIPGARFLHVHPGYLPLMRGADGVLWSTLVRGRPAASCFFLSKGIDTGDIVAAEDFPLPRFPLPKEQRPDDRTLYRALFSFYDPLLRAELLTRTLLAHDADPERLPRAPQDASVGVTYHFMHPELQRVALRQLFPEPGRKATASFEADASGWKRRENAPG